MKKLIIMTLASLILITGCSNKTDKTDDVDVKSGVREALAENGISTDTLEILDVVNVSLTNNDKENIKEKYSNNLAVYKKEIDIRYENIDYKAEGKISLIFVYYDGKWVPGWLKYIDDTNWKYIAKKGAQPSDILNSLKTIEFTGFVKGDVGKDSNTEIEILSQETDLSLGTDIIKASITIAGEFAYYNFTGDFNYSFASGSWNLVSHEVADTSLWKVTYMEGIEKPQRLSEEDIIGVITDKTNLLSYVFDKNKVVSHSLKNDVEYSSSNQVVYKYVLNLHFKDIGKVEYEVLLPFKWIGGSWSKQDLIINPINSDLTDMFGEWTSDEITITISESEISLGESKSKYDAQIFITDAKWNLALEKTLESGSIKLDTTFIVDTLNGSLSNSGYTFIKK